MAHFDFLFCSKKNLQSYQNSCVNTDCLKFTLPYESKKFESCITERAKSCYCLTYLGGRYFRTVPFDFNPFAIHGNFCGWRNSAIVSNTNAGLTLDQKTAAFSSLEAVSELDEICKKHDLGYIEKTPKICVADRVARAKFLEFAFVMKNKPQEAELATVMERSLEMSQYTCFLLEWILKL